MRRRGLGRAGRPSLVGTMARTAVVAGTATAVSGRVAERQHERSSPAGPPGPPAAPGGASSEPAVITDDVFEQLKKLGELKDAGILTEQEFAAKKAQLLG